jgi:hypothetical protein
MHGLAQECRYWDSLKYVLKSESAHGDDKLTVYEQQYKSFIEDLRHSGIDTASPKKFHKQLFKKFQDVFCGKYVEDSQLPDVFEKQTYNCANAALLYASVAKECGVDIHIFMTEDHVFLGYLIEDSFYPIELVNPEGGLPNSDDIVQAVDFWVREKLITKAELKEKGYFTAFVEDVRHAKEINFKKLLSIDLTNLFLHRYQQKDYGLCYSLIDKIIPLSNDSLTKELFWASSDALARENSKNLQIQKNVLGKLFATRDTSLHYKDALLDILSLTGENLINGNDNMFLDSMLQAIHSIYPQLPVEDSRYQNLYFDCCESRAEALRIKGDYIGIFSVIRQLFLAMPQLNKVKAFYCDNCMYCISRTINKGEYENSLFIADSLNKDIPSPNCLSELLINEACNGLFQKYEQIDEAQLGEKEKYFNNQHAKYPEDTLFTFFCKTICRVKTMRAVKENNWDKARALAAEALRLYPTDAAVKHEEDLVEEQYKGYLKYKKYTDPGRKVKSK